MSVESKHADDEPIPPRLHQLLERVSYRVHDLPIQLENSSVAGVERFELPDFPGPIFVIVIRPKRDVPTVTAIRQAWPLTRRQAEVAQMMALGYSDKHIARVLGVKHSCVSRHGEQVRAKLGISSRRYVLQKLLGT